MTRPQTLRPLLAAVCVASLLAGCATVGPDFKAPQVPAADHYAQAGDDPITAPGLKTSIGEKVISDWWTLFKSPGLNELMREAIAASPTLEQARAKLAQARDAEGAEGGLLTADLTAGVKRSELNLNAFSGGAFSSISVPGLSLGTNPTYNLYSIGGAVSYNFDLFGGQRRLRESLKARADEQARELDAAYLTLTGNVVKQVLTIADANIQMAAMRDIAADDQNDLDMIVRARKAGGASDADVEAARGQLATDVSEIPYQRQRWVAARHALAVLVGRSPTDFSPPDFDANSGSLPDSLPVSLPSALVHDRPDILEAEAKLHAATAEIGVATADLYPNITLNASLGQDALTPQTIFSKTATSWAFGPALTVPIFHSGELRARKREAEDAARAELAAYEQTVLEAFAQVDDLLQAIEHDNQTYAEQTKALIAAQNRVNMSRKGFAAGGVSARDLLSDEQTVRRARLTLQNQGTGRYSDAALLLLAVAGVPKGATDRIETAGR
jgi:NodT family efflux transporter outer membrane factor (OMF) lipoprotein